MTEPFADKATLEALGWPRILAAWASRTTTLRGREIALARQFLPDRRAADIAFARLNEARRCQEAGESLPLDVGETDVRPGLARARKRATLATLEMLACARLIDTAYAVRQYIASRCHDMPALARLVEPLPDLRETSRDIHATVSPSGEVRDDASSELQALRQRAQRLQQSIKERIDGMLQAPEFAGNLQDQYYSVRGDRYVLPIIASFQSRVPGIVHNVSQTGQTVFIEPQELVPLGNALAIAQADVLEEERRILAALSADIGTLAEPMLEALEVLGTCDVTFAAATLARDFNAVSPLWGDQGGPIRLPAMRQPLLLLQQAAVVPNDVHLAATTRALVISGPNAGGKTALLSGVGLCVLMARAGLAVPTGSAPRLPWFAGVGCVIGDAQDMRAGLSSFSGHLHALKKMLRASSAGWLLLVDEIAADTDPHEGAALARAALESMVEAGAHVLVTTHLEEIKVLALTDARFANASVALAPDTMRPTYTLTLGSAGFSRALAVAEQVGLPAPIMARAHGLLNDAGMIASTMRRLQEREDDLLAQRTAVAADRADLQAQQEAARLATLAGQKAVQSAKQDAIRELQAEVETVRAQVRGMMKDLQAQPSMRAAHRVEQTLGQHIDTLNVRANPAAAVLPAAAPEPGSWRAGMPTHVAHLGQDGEVLQRDGESALVLVGALRVRVKLSQLSAPRNREKKRVGAFGDSKKAPDRVMAQSIGHTKERCDVRGMRADDACRAVERAMDVGLSAGHRQLIVVHGLGTGALRASVRELLQHSPYVSASRPGTGQEGGEGVTVVDLGVA